MYQRILVPVDGSNTAAKGLTEAIRLAKLTGGQIRLLNIIDEMAVMLAMDAYAGQVDEWSVSIRNNALRVLEQAKASAAAEGVTAEPILRESSGNRVSDHILTEATQWNADLIVLGTHGRRGLGRLLLGSDAETVLRQAVVPVLLIRDTEASGKSGGLGETIGRMHLPKGSVASE